MKSACGILSFSVLIISVFADDKPLGRSLDKDVNEVIMGKMGNSYATQFFEKCTVQHGDATYLKVLEAFQGAEKCLGPVLYTQTGATFFSAVLMMMMTKDKENLCQMHAPKIEQCLYPPIESLKGCSSSVGHKDLELVKSSVHQAMRYACHNKGQRITDFIRQQGFDCLIGKKGEIIFDCFTQRAILFEQMGKNVSIFSDENCRIHAASNKCIMDNYMKCTPNSSPKAIEFVKGLIDAAVQVTPCSTLTQQVDQGNFAILSSTSSTLLVWLLASFILLI